MRDKTIDDDIRFFAKMIAKNIVEEIATRAKKALPKVGYVLWMVFCGSMIPLVALCLFGTCPFFLGGGGAGNSGFLGTTWQTLTFWEWMEYIALFLVLLGAIWFFFSNARSALRNYLALNKA